MSERVRVCQSGHAYPAGAVVIVARCAVCGSPPAPFRPMLKDAKPGGSVTRDGVQRHDAGGIARIT